MKIDRLLGIIHVLMKEDKVTAPYLADVFEVSRRTINRDIDTILLAGIPIVTSQGYDGGIWLDERYKMDKVLWKKDELQAIIAGLKGIDSISNVSYLNQMKQRFAFCNDAYFMKQDVLLIDLSSHYKEAIGEKISTIKKAILDQHNIKFSYYQSSGNAIRMVEPHLLAYQWSSWYLIGFCHQRMAFRMFKLNRIGNLKMCDCSFLYREIPSDLIAFSTYFKDNIHTRAIFQKQVVYRVIDEYGIDSVIEQENGTYLFDRTFTNFDYALTWYSSFTDTVEVLEPLALKERLGSAAANMVKIYERHDI